MTRWLLLMTIAAWMPHSISAQGTNAKKSGMNAQRLAKIPVRMKAYVDGGKAAGIVTLIAHHGATAQLSAVGFQDIDKKTPMRTDSLFRIASMTKPVTSVGIMILAEEGLLALTDPVEKHLPEFRGQKMLKDAQLVPPSRVITIRDLLTHTSGMSTGGPSALADKTFRTVAEVVAIASQAPLDFEPGTRWQYSNVGMATLGRIIEVVSGQSYASFLSERILLPLGMKDTTFFPRSEQESRVATIYTDDNGVLKRATIGLPPKGARYTAPEGGLYSTAEDMARFYQMMLNKGTLDGRQVLSPASVDVMTSLHTGDLKAGFAPGMGYGLGWSVVRDAAGTFRLNSIGTYGHGGAFRTYGWVDPSKDMLGVIMLQRTNGGGDLADEISSFMEMAAAAIER